MKLSANFDLTEFIHSDYAVRLGRKIKPSEEEIANLTRLCLTVMQPLRNEVRSNILISSGLRPDWLNRAIGGSPTSAHMFGCAVDFRVSGMKNEDVCRTVKELQLPIDQCILEFPPSGWVHIGVERVGAKARGQFLTAVKHDGKVVYIEGIHPSEGIHP